MTATTTYKAVEDCKTDNNYSANKQEMVDYVLTSDLSKDKSEVFSDLASQGYYQKAKCFTARLYITIKAVNCH